MNKAKVSIIIPYRPSDHGFDDTVNSLLTQSYQDFEILVLTYGSDDPSIRVRTSHHTKIRVISAEQTEPAAARNLGIANVTSDLMCFLYPGDKLGPTFLEKASNVFSNDATLALVAAWMQVLDDDHRVWKPDKTDLPTLLCERTVCQAALARTSAVRAIGGYDEAIPEETLQDWDLWVSLLEKGFQIGMIPEVLIYQCHNPDFARANAEPYLSSLRYSLEKHRESYDQHLRDILLFRDGELSDVLRSNYEIERYMHTWLVPEVARRQEELKCLTEKLQKSQAGSQQGVGDGTELEQVKYQLSSTRQGVLDLKAELARCREEIIMLKTSRSWRITAPLRFLYDFLSRPSENLTQRGFDAPIEKKEGELHALGDKSIQSKPMLAPVDRRRVEFGDLYRTTPISPEWGADRGRCIDRYYIEQFLESNAADIHGAVLEVNDNDYTVQFGGGQVERSDVIDIEPTNRRATIIADLCDARAIPSHTYDCFIMTQTLHVIYDIRAVLSECVRILRPGGVLLATLPCAGKISHEQGLDGDFWRFTEAAARRLFTEYFAPDRLEVRSYGNVLVGIAYLYGLACRELSEREFASHDPTCPLILSVRAQNV